MLYIILALVFYTAVTLLGAVASRNIDSNIVTAIMNGISAIIPIVAVIPMLNKKVAENGKFGILIAVIGGVCIALFSMAINKSYAGNKVGIVTPIVFGGTIFLSTLISYFFLKEKVSFIQGIGLVLMGMGMLFVIYTKATGK